MTPLENNRIKIQELIDKINALPEQEEATPVLLQEKSVTPTTATPTTASQTVKPDSGYDGLSQVTVNAMPTATQATPSISVSTAGLITASATQSAGYVAAGTKSATKQLTTQAAKTITPSKSSQTAVASGVYTTGAVTVEPIPSSYVQPTATKAATTYTPTTSNQTIAAGTYCSGTQTIKGDANLVPANIKSGVSIFGVTGTASSGGGGSSAQTCTVTIDSGTTVFGWGEFDVYLYGSYYGAFTIPSTSANTHFIPVPVTRVFKNVPIGATFTFYDSDGIKSVSCSDTIEFGFANHYGTSTSTYSFAVCRVNGDGEITITTK